MAGEWKTHRVGDIAAAMGDAPFGSLIKNHDYTDSGALVVQGKNIQGRTCDWSDRRYVSHDKYQSLRRSHCMVGDLLFPKVGTIGKVGILTACRGVDEYVLSTNTMRFRADPKLATADYVYYFFTWSETVNLIHALNSNSVQPVFNFTSLKNFEIPLPPLAEQKAIAAVLGALDDKIELNRRMNATLEAMARALFKSWFIDFDPVRWNMDQNQPSTRPSGHPSPTGRRAGDEGRFALDPATAALFPEHLEDSPLGHIPKGWTAQRLPDAIEVNPRRTLKSGTIAPYLDMKNLPTQGHSAEEVIDREFSSGTKFQNGDTLLARITPCLENGKTGYVDFLEDGQVGWGSTEYIILAPKPPLPPQFGYLLARSDALRTHAIQNMTGTSGRQRVPSECFNTFWLAVPTPDIARRFDELTAPLMAKIKANSNESRTLATLRDTLLPKLLSGELSVTSFEE
jgi:type I restriction enzyme S subunit